MHNEWELFHNDTHLDLFFKILYVRYCFKQHRCCISLKFNNLNKINWLLWSR